jgi:broad specificity phosphatase PhoE
MTNIYFVRHAQSCSNIAIIDKIQHPPLSYKGIQQAVYLGIDNEIIDQDFEEYYCSPSLRTIMTACLALRKITKNITLKLDSNLIENKNHAATLSKIIQEIKHVGLDIPLYIEDQQNAVVKSENLKKMIDYIKLWFQNKYFNNFIDYEFIDLIYDLVLLLHINNQLDLLKSILLSLFYNDDETKTRTTILNNIIEIIESKGFDNFESPLIYITKLESKLSINNNKYDILSFLNGDPFEICIYHSSKKTLKLSVIIESLKKFLDKDYYFNNNITISYDYNEEDPDIKKIEEKHKIQNFIDSLDKDKKNILCFSHGETLREYFKYKENKLKNTEIVCYNTETNQNKRIKRDEMADIPESLENICGNILYNPDYRMFYVINKYFNDDNYKVNDDEKVLEFYKTHKDTKTKEVDDDFVNVSLRGGRYKHKYLKYKYKYLNYKKIKLNN